jgi:hypothetical protein
MPSCRAPTPSTRAEEPRALPPTNVTACSLGFSLGRTRVFTSSQTSNFFTTVTDRYNIDAQVNVFTSCEVLVRAQAAT